jgi:osmotically-inducible protein OsmY
MARLYNRGIVEHREIMKVNLGMKGCAVCCAFAFFSVGLASAQSPQPPGKEKMEAATRAKAAEEARKEAEALARAQERAVENYQRNKRLMDAAAEKEKARAERAAAAARAAEKAAKSARAKAEAAARKRARVDRAEQARRDAAALARAQEYAVANYRRHKGLPYAKAPARPVRRVERLACITGSEDRHARIGVEVVDGSVDYFAYYSKWKPRTCSIEVRRGGAFSRWEDHGSTSKVILSEEKGVFLIDRTGSSYRFQFRNIDRGRYCGMDGKINGSLTVVRGKRECVVHGVMDGHSG